MTHGKLTDKTEIEAALRGAGRGYVVVHLDRENGICGGVKVTRIIEGDDPVFVIEGVGIPEVHCALSNIRNCQIL